VLSLRAVTRAQSADARRTRGSIDKLPSGALRVRVYAGVDPVSKRRHDLIEIIPSVEHVDALPRLCPQPPLTVPGQDQVGALDADTLDAFYAELRRCRDHCVGRPFIQHRTAGEHECDHHCAQHRRRPLGATL
jgi:hypothetical protein